jgi:hypothetical protein
VTTLRLIQSYSMGAAGLAFRLRIVSPYPALARRLREQPR